MRSTFVVVDDFYDDPDDVRDRALQLTYYRPEGRELRRRRRAPRRTTSSRR